MADKKDSNDEPSIEEILSSIRDIISDDDDGDQDVPPPQPVKTEKPDIAPQGNVVPSTDSEKEDDILDLSEFAEDSDVDENMDDDTNPLAGIDLRHPAKDDFDLVDRVDNDEVASIIENAEEEEFSVSSMSEVDKDALVEGMAETATIGAMAKLAENISLARSHDGVTLEDIVRELLRPMLKNWLDDNLPPLIERLVSHELERLAQKAARK